MTRDPNGCVGNNSRNAEHTHPHQREALLLEGRAEHASNQHWLKPMFHKYWRSFARGRPAQSSAGFIPCLEGGF